MSFDALTILFGETLLIAVVFLLALVRDRVNGRSLLYVLASLFARALRNIGALIPAIASVIEEIPTRLGEEWRWERDKKEFEIRDKLRLFHANQHREGAAKNTSSAAS